MGKEKIVLFQESNNTYFKKWTGIGPMTTKYVSEAEVFESKEEAMRSPAYTFSMTFFEPKTI